MSKRFVTMADVLRFIEAEGVAEPLLRRGGVDVRTPLDLARASSYRALCDVRAFLEYGEDAAISAAHGITESRR